MRTRGGFGGGDRDWVKELEPFLRTCGFETWGELETMDSRLKLGASWTVGRKLEKGEGEIRSVGAGGAGWGWGGRLGKREGEGEIWSTLCVERGLWFGERKREVSKEGERAVCTCGKDEIFVAPSRTLLFAVSAR